MIENWTNDLVFSNANSNFSEKCWNYWQHSNSGKRWRLVQKYKNIIALCDAQLTLNPSSRLSTETFTFTNQSLPIEMVFDQNSWSQYFVLFPELQTIANFLPNKLAANTLSQPHSKNFDFAQIDPNENIIQKLLLVSNGMS